MWAYGSVITYFSLTSSNMTNVTLTSGLAVFDQYIIFITNFTNFTNIFSVGFFPIFRFKSGGMYLYNSKFQNFSMLDEVSYLIGLEYCDGVLENTKFYNAGILAPYPGYYQFSDVNNLIWYWVTYNATVYNCEFINEGIFSLFSSFILFSSNISPILILNSKFIAKNKISISYYIGIISTGSPNVNFSNNYVKSLECPNYNIFDHDNGIASFSVSTTYSKITNPLPILFVSINNTFEECYCKTGGSLAVINFDEIIIENCVFNNNTANLGGHFAIISSITVLLRGITMNVSKAIHAGIFYLLNIDNFIISDSFINNSLTFADSSIITTNIQILKFFNITISNIISLKSGGLIMLSGGLLIFSNSNIINISAINQGGVIYGNNNADIKLFNLFINNCSSENGGFIYLDAVRIFEINEVKIENTISTSIGGVFFINELYLLQISNLYIQNSISMTIAIIYIISTENNGICYFSNLTCEHNIANEGSCLMYQSSNNLYIFNVEISNNYGSPMIIFWNYPVEINISSLIVKNNQAKTYIISIEGVSININNLNVFNNSAASNIISLNNLDNCYIYQALFYENQANSIINGKNFIIILNQTYFDNFNNYSIFLILGDIINLIVINSIISKGNSTEQGLFYLFDSQINIKNSSFLNIFGPVFYLISCSLTIKNSLFSYNIGDI